MNSDATGKNPEPKSLPARLYRWIDKRTGLGNLMKESLDEPIPGGARWAYVFGSGLLFIFISQVITGLCLTLYYVPSAESAHTSVAYITKQVAAGAFLRSLHYYGSSAMIIVLGLHFLQTFLYGSFKGRRELLWLSGAVLSMLVLGMGFTGYLLPWDQKAYFATAVGTNIAGQVPLIGEWLTRLMRGGDTLGTLTISRFYVAHVFLIPGMIFLFIAVHIALFRKAGPAGPIAEDPIEPKMQPEGFYPKQVLMDMAFALLLMVGLGFLAYFHPVELGPVANPANTQFIPRPEWYYLPMFEWLKFWEGPRVLIGMVVIPGTLALLFFLLPFLDRKLERRPWRRPIPLLAVAIVLTGTLYLGMRSRQDDARDPAIAAQLALQEQQEKQYNAEPFHPFIESPGGAAAPAPSGPVNPQVAQGRGVFDNNGCSGCHGETGMGGPAAPGLSGITTKYTADQITAMLHTPTAKMRAGGMPAFDLSAHDLSALLSYLAVIGTSAANVPAAYSVAQPKGEAPHPVAPAAPATASAPVPDAATLAAGQQFFHQHSCFVCHGPTGGGNRRIPPMSTLLATVKDAQLEALLRAPSAKMHAGGMGPVQATPEQMTALLAYLRSLAPAAAATPAASTSANAAPASVAAEATPAAAPTSATAGQNPPAAAQTSTAAPKAQTASAQKTHTSAGRTLFVNNGCAACHGQNAQGTAFAPSLAGVPAKLPQGQFAALLRNPTQKMRDGGMPKFPLNDSDMQQLAAYLNGLSGGSARQAPAQAAQSHAASGHAASSHAGHAAPTPAQRPLTAEELRGKAIFERSSCASCHGESGLYGTVAAPPLAGTASELPAAMIANLLRHHSKPMQQGGMPLTNFNASDMQAIVAYIRSLPDTPPAQ
jgi:ubiquinol-cytochrome c reductase cytochrome b subunit